ncbi:MAG: oligosaccharide flippase family protein [Candidatus Bathyarchaeota archaeon]|nr:oligosaccharide flippase family protein [Candidatus Bathyarchaeota archaeon]
MDKALDMGKSSATGSFQLLIGVVASTVIMALGTVILTRILGTGDYGLYSIAMIPSSLINFFRDWGVNSAMTKQIASLRAADKNAEIHGVIVSGVIFEIISGAALALLSFALAEPLAIALQRPETQPLIALMSISIFAGAVMAAANGIFVGFEKMSYNSFTSVFQAVIKTGVAPFLVLIGYGVFGAVVGTIASIAGGAAAAIILLYFLLFRKLPHIKDGASNLITNLKPMISYGIPLTISNIVIGVLPQVFAFIMAIYITDNTMIGNYYAALNFSVLLTFISVPVSTVLFPAFAKLDPKEEPALLKKVFSSSVKYTSVLLVPATLAVIVLATPIVYTLFGQTYAEAPSFLALSAIVNLYAVVGNISLGTLLTGIGETTQLLKQSILSMALSIPFAFIIIPYLSGMGAFMGVVGGIVAILFSSVPGMIWGLIWIWQKYRAKVDFSSSAKIMAASLLAAGVTYGFLLVFNTADLLRLLFGAAVFVGAYLITAPLLGAVNHADIKNFKEMFTGLGFISKLVSLLLKIMEKTLSLRGA